MTRWKAGSPGLVGAAGPLVAPLQASRSAEYARLRPPVLADADTGRALTASDRLPVASLTKPVVATAAVRLWLQRGIALDAPMVDLLARARPVTGAPHAGSRCRHLLSHTSGLRVDVAPDEAEDTATPRTRWSGPFGGPSSMDKPTGRARVAVRQRRLRAGRVRPGRGRR